MTVQTTDRDPKLASRSGVTIAYAKIPLYAACTVRSRCERSNKLMSSFPSVFLPIGVTVSVLTTCGDRWLVSQRSAGHADAAI